MIQSKDIVLVAQWGAVVVFLGLAWQVIKAGRVTVTLFLLLLNITGVFLWAHHVEAVSNMGFGIWMVATLGIAGYQMLQKRRSRRLAEPSTT